MNLFEKEKKYFLQTYSRIPIEIKSGKGIYLIDKNGKKYSDFFSGLGVNALGYAHPRIIEAVSKQISLFAHLSNNFITDIQNEFTEKLLFYSKMSKAFLTNSGTESIEGALKLIRKKFGPDKKIFSLSNSFHGRTYGSMTLTGRDKYRKGFEPLLPNIRQLDFNNVDELTNSIDENTAAIFLEFIQGEGGINEVSIDYINKLEELRRKYEFLVVADAIQDGIGRSGKLFVHEYYNFKPDIIITAKAIGGGLPLGAFLVNEQLINVFETGKHGTTFGGNPVSCASGKVVLEEVFENGLMENALELGKYFKDELIKIQKIYPSLIKEIRGKGLMIGIELSFPCNKFVTLMRENGFLINCTNENVLRLLPPLIITQNEINSFLETFGICIKNYE